MFMLDQPRAAMPPYMPPPVEQATYSGYKIGGLELLPRHIDAIFMDPPWGGVDYEVVGKNGYCLEKHMKIKVSPDDPSNNNKSGSNNTSASSQGQSSTINNKKDDLDAGDYVSNDFFDTISNSTTKNQTSRSRSNSHEQQLSAEARKANFNKRDDNDSGEFINGADLIQIAAEATCSRVVIYDVPRNMNRLSLGKSALKAGYHGNIKLEEHYLNGRLKTATAYMGADFTFMLDPNFTDD
uniref:Trimethylguanosine synthase n=1 Tax=Craspedostauros australis TaxID=1486917 RepID=A0A7R9X0G2_9STRA|mmetsp:Transcript_5180/g.13956  ORF Transcript_5180/g.13956 Transcript_5180/m.13956 type:complete len:239 (+) Transcript_5180:2-718(+)